MKWSRRDYLSGRVHLRLFRLEWFNRLNWLNWVRLYGRKIYEVGHVGGNANRDPREFTAGLQPGVKFIVSGLGDFEGTVVKNGCILWCHNMVKDYGEESGIVAMDFVS